MLFTQNYVKVSGMDFAQFLKKQAQIINLRLEEVLDNKAGKIGRSAPSLVRLFEKFKEASEGGKRLRGGLVLLGYQAAGGKNPGSILDAAAAFEIFQTAILAQDDVIDRSLLRRGKPSLYAALGGDDWAISQTICLSDLGFFLSFELLGSLKVKDSLKIQAINLFSQTLTKTVMGEMLDVEAPFLKSNFLEEDALKISLLKTAGYTISGPLMLGAILAGANAKTVKTLQLFGDNLGIAFQIQDDILGVFGDEKITGKSASSDIKECKVTLLIAYSQRNGTKDQRSVLEKYYGNQEIDKKGIEAVRKVFRETGALDYANSRSEIYFEKASKSLKGAEEPLLYSLIDFLKKRKS